MSTFTHNEHTCHRLTHLSQACPGLHTTNTSVTGMSRFTQRTHLSQACPGLHTTNTPVIGMSRFTHNEHTCHRHVQVYTQRSLCTSFGPSQVAVRSASTVSPFWWFLADSRLRQCRACDDSPSYVLDCIFCGKDRIVCIILITPLTERCDHCNNTPLAERSEYLFFAVRGGPALSPQHVIVPLVSSGEKKHRQYVFVVKKYSFQRYSVYLEEKHIASMYLLWKSIHFSDTRYIYYILHSFSSFSLCFLLVRIFCTTHKPTEFSNPSALPQLASKVEKHTGMQILRKCGQTYRYADVTEMRIEIQVCRSEEKATGKRWVF